MLTPGQLRVALEARGLGTLVKMAAALRVSHATVSRWLSQVHPIPDWVEVALRGIPENGTPRAQANPSSTRKSSK